MEPTKDTTKKNSEDKTMVTEQQNPLTLEQNSSYVVSFPHTTESLSVYSFQNVSISAAPTPQRKHVQHR